MKEPPLRRRIRLFILLPIAVGSLVTALVSLAPIFMRYSTWIDNIITDIVNDEGTVLMQVSSQEAALTAGFLQSLFSEVFIMGQLMQNYYNGDLLTKPNFNETTYQSEVSLFEENETTPNSNFSMWYLNPYISSPKNLPFPADYQLNDSGIFDSFMLPIFKTNTRTTEFFYAFNDSGLFYLSPAVGSIYLQSDTASTCYFSENSTYFDPRCRPWYEQTYNSAVQYLPMLTDPYYDLTVQEMRQVMCTTVWFEETLILVLCLDFKLTDLESYLQSIPITNGNSSYAFTLTPDGTVFTHPLLSRSENGVVPSITDLEFGNDTSEAQAFNETILPYLTNGTSAFAKYTKNGETMLIAINPVNVALGLNNLFRQVLAVGVVMPESSLYSQVNSLKSDGDGILLAELLIFLGIMVGVLICGWLYFLPRLTKYVVNSIVKPLDELAEVLERMMGGDLMIDIREPAKKCSKEIMEMYQVFGKLKVALRFGHKEFFETNDAEALMNFSQALQLFTEFKNNKGIRICSSAIGRIHLQNKRYQEAIDSYQEALNTANAQDSESRYRLHSPRDSQTGLNRHGDQVLTCATDLAAALMEQSEHTSNVRWTDAVRVLKDAVEKHSLNVDPQHLFDALYLLSICYVQSMQFDSANSVIEDLNNLRVQQDLNLHIPSTIIEERIMFVQGLMEERKGQFRTAGEIYTKCLIGNSRCDPEIRRKCLIRLRNLFEARSIESGDLTQIIEDDETVLRDVVFLVEYSDNMKQDREINQVMEQIKLLFDNFIGGEDRVSLILFSKTHHTAFNLTSKSSNTKFLGSNILKWSKPSGDRDLRLYDALLEAISEFTKRAGGYDCELLENMGDSLSTRFQRRVRWVLLLTTGGDVCSDSSYYQVQGSLQYFSYRQFNVRMFCVGLRLEGDALEKIKGLCQMTRRGKIVNCGKKEDLDSAFRQFKLAASSIGQVYE